MLKKFKTAHHPKSPFSFLFFSYRKKVKEEGSISLEIKRHLEGAAKKNIEDIFKEFGSSEKGISQVKAAYRLKKYGSNEILVEKPPTPLKIFLNNLTNPFVLLLSALALVSFALGNKEAVVIIVSMVLLGVIMRFIQEYRASNAAAKLKALVSTKATVLRGSEERKEISFKDLTPGDVICLSPGDMIPADVRLFYAHDLFLSQSSLTGEAKPVEKNSFTQGAKEEASTLALPNICFMGTNVISGIGKAIVLSTGNETYFGSLAEEITTKRPETSFDKGINKVSFLLIKMMLAMIPIVFFINGLNKGEWFNSLLFALSVAVGLTPEMLPMIVTTNLAKGALVMAKAKVIVKQLGSIQNFGAMDILCTDKTGTLTENRVILEQYLTTEGEENGDILSFAYCNSYFQTGLKNLLDTAILEHKECEADMSSFQKVDEIPFDFERKRTSIVVDEKGGKRWLIAKGSFDSILHVCSHFKYKTGVEEKSEIPLQKARELYDDFNRKGFRVLALAAKELPLDDKLLYHPSDENDLTFLGFLTFLDPPKESAKEALEAMQALGVNIKVITGDDLLITKHVCELVGIKITLSLTGEELEQMDKETRKEKIPNATIFARVNPHQKAEIIQELKSLGHIVGYIGDGINDAAALRESDIGISVDSAADIAKESSDIIMLEKSLLFLSQGIIEGRKTFANILKYIKMAISSNFGNVLSILGASYFLPFLPMLPIQLLLQNLLYDISQIAIPFDQVDPEYLAKPREWQTTALAKFMFFIGPISSIFDYVTFGVLWFVFQANTIENQALFQTGWFVEGLASQILIVHMIRTAKIPFIESRPSAILFFTTLAVMAFGFLIPYTFIGKNIGMAMLPGSYFLYLIPIILAYCLTTQVAKFYYIRKFKSWL